MQFIIGKVKLSVDKIIRNICLFVVGFVVIVGGVALIISGPSARNIFFGIGLSLFGLGCLVWTKN